MYTKEEWEEHYAAMRSRNAYCKKMDKVLQKLNYYKDKYAKMEKKCLKLCVKANWPIEK